ncbi:carboxypeptidase A2-like protein, partial [Corchorus olitorius]
RQLILFGIDRVNRAWIRLIAREEDLQLAAVDLVDHPHQRHIGDPGSSHQPAGDGHRIVSDKTPLRQQLC